MKEKQVAKNEKINFWAEDFQLPEASEVSEFALTLENTGLCETARRLLALRILAFGLRIKTIKKAEIVGVTDRRVRQIENDPDYQKVSIELVKQRFGRFAVEVFSAFIEEALNGNSANQVLYLREMEILSKENKGDTNVNVNVSFEKLKEKREKNWEDAQNRLRNVINTDN